MMTIATTKNQHYVSQGILKHFSDNQKKTFELFIEKKIISKKRIDNTMSQNYVYEHPQIETNTLEDIFANFESKAIPLVDKLICKLEEEYRENKCIKKYFDAIFKIIPFALLFYFRSGALLREYSMDVENPKNIRVERMMLNIMDVNYIRGLRNTICKCYHCGIIVDENERFLLSDQYVSTAALKYKNKFSNMSNRQIGMKDTIILIPLSAKFYIVFFYGNIPPYISENHISILCEKDVQQINNVIFQNSYVKCVGKSESELMRVKDIEVESYSPIKSIMKYDNGNIQNRILKREVFMYDEDKDMNAHSFEYMSTYMKEIKGKIGRNDRCICGSGRKYKNCCMYKYERAAEILVRVQNFDSKDYTIPGVEIVEDSILDYKGKADNIPNKRDQDIINKVFNMDKEKDE